MISAQSYSGSLFSAILVVLAAIVSTGCAFNQHEIAIDNAQTAQSKTNEPESSQADRPTANEPMAGITGSRPPGLRAGQPDEQLKSSPPENTDTMKPSHAYGTDRERQHSIPLRELKGIGQVGSLAHPDLTELSGLSASRTQPGVLYAINDSGNQSTLFALSESGDHLGQWELSVANRDWEDMSSLAIDGEHYLVIGDTGDNMLNQPYSRLLFLREPTLDQSDSKALNIDFQLLFKYEDGPRNVEAFAADQRQIILLSKERIVDGSVQPSQVYALDLPQGDTASPLIARKLASVTLALPSVTSRLVAAVAGVDMNQPTAMDIDPLDGSIYILTYRQVLKFRRTEGQSWAEVFAQTDNALFSHSLGQAEALAVAPGRAILFSSETRHAPLWAIPLIPPL